MCEHGFAQAVLISMTLKEKIFAAAFAAGLLMLAGVAIFAFVQERYLLGMQELAEAEYRSEELLDSFTDSLRDVRRKGLNYILVRSETSPEKFQEAVEEFRELAKFMREHPGDFGGHDHVEPLIAAAEEYVWRYERIVATAETHGAEEALRQISEAIEVERLDPVLDRVDEMESIHIQTFAERSAEISEGLRIAMAAIGFMAALSAILIAVSVGMMLRYYSMNRLLLAETRALNKGLEASRKEMESIVSFVSHDLRAPLINVKGFAAALEEDREKLVKMLKDYEDKRQELRSILEESTPEALDFIGSAADSMERLINTMVKVARAGQLAVDPQRIDVNELVEGIVKDFEFRIQDAGAAVEVEPLPACRADVDQVRQVFSNLIDNAIKYRASSRPLRVLISGRVEGEQSVYCVEDNGVGIAEEDLYKVTEVFYQAKNMSAGGEGLGLAIARKMVEHNGGALEMESTVDRGSRFFVKLPSAAAPGKKNPGGR